MHTLDKIIFRNATPTKIVVTVSQASLNKIVSHFTMKITSVVILIFQMIKEQKILMDRIKYISREITFDVRLFGF